MKSAVIVSFGPSVGQSTNCAGRVPPAVAVDVEGVEVAVHADHVHGDPLADRARIVGVLPADVRPLMQWNRRGMPVTCGGNAVQEQQLLDVRRRRALLADHDPAEQAAQRVERVVRAVVVVGPDAHRVRRGLPDVGELLARADEAAGAREVAQVAPSYSGVVADPVRVDGDRLAQAGVRMLRKWTTITSPTSAWRVGPGHAADARRGARSRR